MEHGPDRFARASWPTSTAAHGSSRYFLPLTVRWTRYTAVDRAPACVLAAVRRGPREGTLLDAVAEPEFVTALLTKIHAGETIGARRAQACSSARPRRFHRSRCPMSRRSRPSTREQSNSSVIVDSEYVIKIFRRIQPGIHSEIEIGRFLTDETAFKNAPALLGSVELVEGDDSSALAVVHAFVENQGDAWTVDPASLDRLIDDAAAQSRRADRRRRPETLVLLQRMRQIGRRTAELHQALGKPRGHRGLCAGADRRRRCCCIGSIRSTRAPTTAFDLLAGTAECIAGRRRAIWQNSCSTTASRSRRISQSWRDAALDGVKIRHHGDFHLGQMLIAKDDAYILDFEGEPRRSLEERRHKAPPARDVAGLIRSIDYAISAAIDHATDLSAGGPHRADADDARPGATG